MEKLISLLLLGFLVFFGRWNLQGLSPDAALYAGLSLKILQTGEYWHLSASENFFPKFFEHPPFFFQWGSLVLRFLGISDGAARSIGAIPGYFAFASLIIWSYLRLGFSKSFILAVLLLSFGHYTKYAATSMMEASLSLGVILAVIGCVEFLILKGGGKWTYLLCAVGSFVSVASKGVAGFAVFGCIFVSLFISTFIFKSRIEFKKITILLSLVLISSLLPMVLWAWFTHPSVSGDQTWYFIEYLDKQVFRSFLSNRGSSLHSESGSRLRYVQVILKYGWPWWWTVPVGLFYFYKKRVFFFVSNPFILPWMLLSLSCFFCFFIPFSLSTFQLPHYIHPVYLPLAPIGAVFVDEVLARNLKKYSFIISSYQIRWLLVSVLFVAMFSMFRGVSTSSNRGQEFIAASTLVNQARSECLLQVEESAVDPYRMEAFSLWYFKGRSWQRVPSFDLSVQNNKNSILWFPGIDHDLELVIGEGC